MAAPALISFAMGMNTSAFADALKSAGTKLAAFFGATLSLGGVAAGVAQQISQGADLDALQRRLGIAAGAIAQLRSAFTSVDISSEGVVPALQSLQRALSGVSEMGEPTKAAFDKIGLSMESLRAMRSNEALDQIVKKLATLNQNDAMRVASTMFGKGLAGDLVQASRSLEDWNSALDKSSWRMAAMQRNAKIFSEFETSLSNLKKKFQNVFLGLAEGVIPSLKKMVDWLNNSINFDGVATQISLVIRTISEAFTSGKIGELFGLSLQVGAAKAVNFISALFQGYFAGLGQWITNIFKNIPTLLVDGFQSYWNLLGSLHDLFRSVAMSFAADLVDSSMPALVEIGTFFGQVITGRFKPIWDKWRTLSGGLLPEWKNETTEETRSNIARMLGNSSDWLRVKSGAAAESATDKFNQSKESAGKFLGTMYGGVADAAIKAIQDAVKIMPDGPTAELKKLWDELKVAAEAAREKGRPDPNNPDDDKRKKMGGGQVQGDALTRIGFIFGGGSSWVDYTRRTADNTDRMVQELRRLAGGKRDWSVPDVYNA